MRSPNYISIILESSIPYRPISSFVAAGETLILEARDFKDLQHWRWMLKDILAKLEFDLDSGYPNYSAFIL